MIPAAEPTLFVAAFNHEDPGFLALAQRCTLFPVHCYYIYAIDVSSTVFGLPTDIVAATLGSIGIKEIADLESKVNSVALMLMRVPTFAPYCRSQTTSLKEPRNVLNGVVSRRSSSPQANASLAWPQTPFPKATAVHLHHLPPLPHLLDH